MSDKKIKLMNRDMHYLLPNFYSKPLLDMKFLKSLSLKQISEIEEQIYIIKKFLD